ncbi:HVO_0234 family beta-propeller protein [Natronococcus occultus]|uniref:HVO-0234-like beta-propeller domain-containing protein n=1 Tax=Natronococcus occultus SP4 TaxID=694430 RepID=L0K670_9EURY|nr:hypothetical protein [Natronococcus occultus]AGB39628.1 hypothetical protein Natoc_3930 [Natronococcus occultus SP4]
MDSIEEKRVYGDREGATRAYVASSLGVVRVRVSGETVGEFGLQARCDAVDAAATDEHVAVATDEDVRLLDPTDGTGDAVLTDTGFGPARAVGADGSELLAASPDGRVGRHEDGAWTTLAESFEPTVRAIDGDLLATDRGVYRVHDGGLDHAGLTDVADVSAPGVPLAATADGLYKLGNGWMGVREEPFDVVAVDPRSEPGSLRRAHAISETGVFDYHEDVGEWRQLDAPGPIVDVGYGDTPYAVTRDGTFLAATDGEWRSQPLGVDGVAALAVHTA